MLDFWAAEAKCEDVLRQITVFSLRNSLVGSMASGMELLTALPNLRHLRGFVAVARVGSLSAAAEGIGLSQPALTQAVAGVERWAGVPLFDRRGTGLSATEPGRILAARVAEGMELLDKGVIAIGVAPAAARQISLSGLRALIAAVEAMGFRAAARILGCQPSSVSRACRELELMLGAPLFDGSGMSMRATRAGEELARVGRLALAEIRQGQDELAEWRGQRTGRLSVGSLPLAQVGILPTALARFAAECPQIEIRVSDGYYADLARGLRRAEIDVIVGALRGADLPDDLVQEPLFDDPLALVARAGHPLAGRSDLGFDDLAAFGWIAPRKGGPARGYFERLADQDHIDPSRPAPIETGAHSVLRGLLQQTDRITLISLAQVADEIESGLLVALPVDLPGSARTIGYTLRKSWRPGLIQRQFLDILRKVARH